MRLLRGIPGLAAATLAACSLVAVAASASGCIKKKETAEKRVEADAAPKKEAAKPKIVALNDKFDFGKVKQGDTVDHIFKIANKGDGELIIERAKGS